MCTHTTHPNKAGRPVRTCEHGHLPCAGEERAHSEVGEGDSREDLHAA